MVLILSMEVLCCIHYIPVFSLMSIVQFANSLRNRSRLFSSSKCPCVICTVCVVAHEGENGKRRMKRDGVMAKNDFYITNSNMMAGK